MKFSDVQIGMKVIVTRKPTELELWAAEIKEFDYDFISKLKVPLEVVGITPYATRAGFIIIQSEGNKYAVPPEILEELIEVSPEKGAQGQPEPHTCRLTLPEVTELFGLVGRILHPKTLLKRYFGDG
jgi:hypothetical protein